MTFLFFELLFLESIICINGSFSFFLGVDSFNDSLKSLFVVINLIKGLNFKWKGEIVFSFFSKGLK